MDTKIRGTFPGGPRKSVAASELTAPARLARVEQIEERAARRYTRWGSRRRRKRLMYGFVSAIAVSGGVGIYMGLQSHATLEEVRAEVEADANGPSDMDGLSNEVNRAMLELWKMEDVEYTRNRR